MLLRVIFHLIQSNVTAARYILTVFLSSGSKMGSRADHWAAEKNNTVSAIILGGFNNMSLYGRVSASADLSVL